MTDQPKGDLVIKGRRNERTKRNIWTGALIQKLIENGDKAMWHGMTRWLEEHETEPRSCIIRAHKHTQTNTNTQTYVLRAQTHKHTRARADTHS